MSEYKSLLKTIEEELGQEIKEKIEDMTYRSNLYILYLMSYHEVTQKDLEAGYASYRVKYPDRTFENYLQYKMNWDRDKFSFDIEPQGYFVDRKTAIEYAEANMGDINEAGSFVIVSSMPLNTVYPMCNFREHTLLHFNRKTGKYEEIDWDYCEATKLLKEKGHSGWF